MPHRYLTTPIYYVNGDPHIGHAHTSIIGDVLKRIALLRGDAAWLTTGTDEHGQKNQEAAEACGLPTYEFLDRQSERFRALFDRLDVSYDLFVRTTAPGHRAAVTEALRRLWQRNLITKQLYRGLYCVGCEQFKRPSDLDGEGRCPDHLVAPVESEEVNYFLVLAPFQAWLIDYITTHEELIRPTAFRHEVLAMLQEPLADLSISRPKSRVTLGIDLPFDAEYVTYVWFDALLNYVSSVGWPSDETRFRLWWPGVTHLMGKDIVKTHCIYWPIMLRALGIDPPHGYFVHGHWVGEGGRKMSKSLGNAVDPIELLDLVGTDGLRYYLVKHMTSGDSSMSTRLVTQTYNSDLANTIGNLYSRVVKLAIGLGGIPNPSAVDAADADVVHACATTASTTLDGVEFETLPDLPKAVLEMATRLNAHIDTVAPWRLAREPEGRDRLESAMYALLESVRLVAELAWPVMPATADRVLASLGVPSVGERPRPLRFEPFALARGAPIRALTEPLFPRIRAA